MHHKTKEAALKSYTALKDAGATQEDLKLAIEADEKGFTSDEVQELLAALANNTPHPASDLLETLGTIDYKALKGETFKKYVELVGDSSYVTVDDDGKELPVVGKLKQDSEFYFDQFRAVPIMKPRYAGVKDTPMDFNGLTIKNDTPEFTTKIPVRVALEHNAQIMNAHSRAGHGRYYLLSKTKNK